MADALFISGSPEYDGDKWYTNDPLAVDLLVTDPDGGSLAATVTAELVGYEDGVTEDSVTASTGTDGEVTVSLTASDVGLYEVQAAAATSSRNGRSLIGVVSAIEDSSVPIPGSGALNTDYTLIDNAISETTLG
jgi:hypothetical protein